MRVKTLLTCLAILCAAYALLCLQLPTPEQPTPIYNQRVPAWAKSLNQYNRMETGGFQLMTYRFIDYTGKKKTLGFSISTAEHQKLSRRFGYNQQSVEKRVLARLDKGIADIISRAGLSQYLNYSLTGRSLSFQPATVPGAVHAKVLETLNKANSFFSKNYLPFFNQELRTRGFYIDGNYIKIDYNTLIEWNTEPLRGCFNSLYATGKGYTLAQYLGLFIAFLQEIHYELPPNNVKGTFTGGIYIPTDVLINNRGDCDSKSIVFCALWRHFKDARLIIVLLHEHALIGVGITPGPGQKSVRLGNTHYVLCEVAGPGKLYPGYVDPSTKGTFTYYMVK